MKAELIYYFYQTIIIWIINALKSNMKM